MANYFTLAPQQPHRPTIDINHPKVNTYRYSDYDLRNPEFRARFFIPPDAEVRCYRQPITSLVYSFLAFIRPFIHSQGGQSQPEYVALPPRAVTRASPAFSAPEYVLARSAGGRRFPVRFLG
jgi:hypothetical protein